MHLTFLSGRQPLTKTITYNAKTEQYHVTPYPLSKRVTSHSFDAPTLRDFHALLQEQALAGHCLLKGHLDRPLCDESRAGHSLDTPHEWIVFDFDRVDCAPTYEGILAAINKYLPPEAARCDAVVQCSSSCAHPLTRKLSAHVFMRLDEPQPTQTLKNWLQRINFDADTLSLTDSSIALHYGIDISIVHPSRLIYIAPPRCIGFTPAVSNALIYVPGKVRAVSIRSFTPVTTQDVRDKINALRKREGLPEQEYQLRTIQGNEYLSTNETCVVHDIKPAGDGYIRFNLNGGDSLGYWVNLREPHTIGNFKGEPFLFTKEVAPDFYKQLIKASKALPAVLPPVEHDVLAFYATNRGSTVHIGYYNRSTNMLRVEPSSLDAARAWLTQHGVPLHGPMPHYDLEYDMTSDIRYEDGYPIINLYKQTELMQQYATAERQYTPTQAVAYLPPIIGKTLMSVLGDSEEAAAYFINWLAYLFQTRNPPCSAWVWHGVQGTGKDNMYTYVLSPLFGKEHCTQQLYNIVATDVNAFLEGKSIVMFNEASIGRDADILMSKLKSWITEPNIVINDKYMRHRTVRNHAGYIFATNDSRPVIIDQDDRRFNVAEFQRQRLIYTPNEFAVLASGEELEDFAKLLGAVITREDWLRTPYAGVAKGRMYEATHSLLERVALAIKENDGQFFIDARPNDTALNTELLGRMLPIKEYDALLTAMAQNTLNVLTINDLYTLFRVALPGDKRFPESAVEQRRLYNRFGLLDFQPVRCRRRKRTQRGYPCGTWTISDRDKLAMQ